MADVQKLVSAPDETKGRLVSIFVGAVLLPSLALSYVAMHFVHQLASARKASEIKYATGLLYIIEKELGQTAQSKALEAAHMLEPEVLLEGRPAEIDAALRKQGVGAGVFQTLRLETSSPRMIVRTLRMGNRREIEVSPEVLAAIGFIAIMLGAGLLLVYSNVRRELHLSRLKSDFVANVSHELKTPLALVRLFAETLELGRVPSEDKAQQYYRVINKESQRLTQLINNILDFPRIEAGRKEYRFAPTDVGRIVNEVLEAYRFQIEQQGFVLEVRVGDDLPEVEADKEALAQAVLNLVNNAIKYSRDEKYLRLDLHREGDKVLLSVTDRGIGVAKGEQKKIFEKFYRAEDSLVHETKGSGLGLALVQHIMQAHGGSVEVESAPGKGSTFTLVLPVRNARS